MKSDILVYVGIVLGISAFVIGFTTWKTTRPTSRKPEQALYLGIAIFAWFVVLWTSFDAYRTFRSTGIDTMRGDYHRLAIALMIAITSAVAFRASRVRERREKMLNQTPATVASDRCKAPDLR